MHLSEQVTPARLADYLEIMSKSVFQSGISWRVVESKWPGVREAMREFDPQTVAMLGEPELDELAQDSRMIRHRRKLSAISANAQRILELEEEHGSFEATLQSIRKEFKYMGDSGTYHFLWTVSEEVPPYEEWCATHERKRR
jgi:3-methyladenine DNA glycosylase Tag